MTVTELFPTAEARPVAPFPHWTISQHRYGCTCHHCTLWAKYRTKAMAWDAEFGAES